MAQEELNWVKRTFGEYGLLSKHLDNYSVREQQVDLASKIQESIQNKTALIAEAPTGVGKSLAALSPAFEHIKKTNEPVVVVTSSIVLQEQYINKDIPFLEQLYNLEVNPVLIKGRNNYLCPKKHRDAGKGSVSFSTTEYLKEYEEVSKWAAVTKTGDVSELDFVPRFPVWSQLACIDSNECTGKQCPLYDSCFYYKERNKVKSSRLIVCNYHYFFTAMSYGAANMLPEEMGVVIMDEGHEISTIARDFQERKYTINSLKHHIDTIAKAAQYAEQHADIGSTANSFLLNAEFDQMNQTSADMFVGLTHNYKKVVTEKSARNFLMLEIPRRKKLQEHVSNHIESLSFGVRECESYLEKYGFTDTEAIPMIAEMYGDASVEWLLVVYQLRNQLEEYIGLLEYIFFYDDTQDDGDDIFWMQPHKESVSVHAKPTTGSALIQPLFEKGDGITPVVMSATLSTNRSFNHLKKDFGISEDPKRYPTEELIVSSPFNLEENLLWFLPENAPPGNVFEHLNFTLNSMRKIIEKLEGRALCLFTSRKNLKEAEIFFRAAFPEHVQVLSQENVPKQLLINKMKENDHTVILGTKSMFTGIDIQGHHLSAVLLDKFPFPMIGDPINDYLMSQPRGFNKFSLPEAIISMKQGFGRLNRTMDDKGIVAVFDGRLATARYKKIILNSFDFKINATKSWDRLYEYIDELKGEMPNG